MKQDDKNNSKKIPWYKNYILWLIIFIPTVTVGVNIFMIYSAFSSRQSPVIEDYYREGIAPLERKNNGISGEVQSAMITNGILKIKRRTPSRDTVILKLEHPTISAKDQYTQLKASTEDTYLLDKKIVRLMRMQRWYIRLYDVGKTWLLEGVVEANPDGLDVPIVLKAQ